MSGLLPLCVPLAYAQLPPPPPPGVVVQMPEKADPAVKVPQFEVVSVKPAKDNQTRVQFTVSGIHGESVTPQFLLLEGFGGVNQSQMIGAPAWAATDGFDVDAKVADADMPTLAKLTLDQRRTMFQQILAERFKLVAHHERRELPIYSLVIAKGGSKLKETAPDDPAAATPRRKGVMFGPGRVMVMGGTIAMFATPLSRLLGRVVTDKTDLTGRYDFTLNWTSDSTASAVFGPPAGGETSGPDLFTAMQEELGLKLEPGKGPVDVVVIDHMEKPAAN